ncbi:MAG: hypothetical protein ACTSYB_12785 [Candidatus Helarchaeota archaeon]
MSLTELVTFKVTKEMRQKMRKFNNVNWSVELRSFLHRKLAELERVERESPVNFCPRCGERLSTPEDNYCRICGNPIPKLGYVAKPR